METFEQWMEHLDQQVIALSGVSVHDLADWPFRSCFEEGGIPEEVAVDILEAEGFEFD